MNDDQIHLEAHVDFTEDISLSEFDRVLEIIENEVRERFSINHISIQPEFDKCSSKSVIVQD
jgi:cobalt-zinc-cadmium efflux system protein